MIYNYRFDRTGTSLTQPNETDSPRSDFHKIKSVCQNVAGMSRYHDWEHLLDGFYVPADDGPVSIHHYGTR